MSDFGPYDVLSSGDAMGEAEPDTERMLGAFPNPTVSESPVVPLGFFGGKVVFAMPEGEIRMEMAAKIGGMLRADIYACAKGQAFLVYWRDSADKFQRELASVWFVRKCREAGYWDADRVQRSLGVWPGDAGDVILHRGHEIWRYAPGGDITKLSIADALRNPRGPLYRLAATRDAPEKASPVTKGQWIRKRLDAWRFEAIGADGLTGADVTAGWLMASHMGAVSPFRGHLLINALAGSGKSTLVEFLNACSAALAGDVMDSFSEAGIKNELNGHARPVHLDEAEASSGANGPGVLERVLEIIRRMATGNGGSRKQGDIGGGTVSQTAIGCVLLAGVNPPKLGSADASRIMEIRLLPLTTPRIGLERMASDEELHNSIEDAKALAPALLGRALCGAARFKADFDAVKMALIELKQSPRAADLVAMLAAGRRLLLFDDPLDAEGADAEAAFWKPLLVEREAKDTVSNPGADALAHLMAADSGQHMHDRRATLGELLQKHLDLDAEYDGVLKAHGLKVFKGAWEDGAPGPWLLVANNHPALERIFERTPWRDWRRSLAYIDVLGEDHLTRSCPKAQRFGLGVISRATAIPLTPWLEGSFHGVTHVTPGVTDQPNEF